MPQAVGIYRGWGVEIARMRAAQGDSFPKHTHDEYVIGANVSAVERVWLDGKTFDAEPGQVTVYNPGAVQSSAYGGTEAVTAFVSVYIEQERVARFVRENAAGSTDAPPAIGTALFHHLPLYHHLLELEEAAQGGHDGEVDALTDELVGVLLSHASHPQFARSLPDATPHVKCSIDYMMGNLFRNVSVDDLAAVARLSKFHYIRTFRDVVGMSPLKYHMQLRLQQARRLLRQGQTIQDATFALGFYDQSHFANAFRKVTGATPQGFARPVWNRTAKGPAALR